MEPKSTEQEIAELEALIERMKADPVKARKAIEVDGDTKSDRPDNGTSGIAAPDVDEIAPANVPPT